MVRRPSPLDLAGMVVEHQVAARHIGKVGDDVPVRDRHDAVLHVLGMDELDLVDQVELAQQHAAHEAVEVAAGDKSELGWRHELQAC